MEKKAPTLVQIGVIVGFVLSLLRPSPCSCGSRFGGPTPLRPSRTRSRSRSTRRPSSPTRPMSASPGSRSARSSRSTCRPTAAGDGDDLGSTPQFAPLPTDTRAILRAKTLLGETYVELTPGSPDGAEAAPRARCCPKAQVATTVQLDEILRTLDAPTREPPSRPGCRTRRSPSPAAARAFGNSFALLPGHLRRASTSLPHPRHPGAGGRAAVRRRRGHLRRPDRAPRPAREPDRDLQRGARDDRGARPARSIETFQRLPDLPRRVAAHPRPPARVLAQRRPADAAADAGGRGALADPDRVRPAGARARGLLRGPATGDRQRRRPPSRPSGGCSATTSRRCCARSTRSCATSTRCST